MNTDSLFLQLKKQKLVYFIGIISIVFGIICILSYICSHAILHEVSYKYEAENLYSTIGNITVDPSASGTQTRSALTNDTGYLIFGPYGELSPGDYDVFFRLKSNYIQNTGNIAVLDIYSDKHVINSTIISTHNLISENTFVSVDVPFHTNGGEDFQFRVNKFSGNTLHLDYIEIVPRNYEDQFYAIFILGLKVSIFFIFGFVAYVLLKNEGIWSSKVIIHLKKYITSEKILFLVVFLVYILIIIGIFHPLPRITGDEPHYLITTNSILEDGDINVKNNYISENYLNFSGGLLESPHIAVSLDGSWIPVHGIGLSVLLILPFYIAGVFGTQIFLAIIAALLVVQIFFLINEVFKNSTIAFISALITSIVSPLIFYSHAIYPETIAALIFTYSLRILFQKISNNFVKSYQYCICGMAIALLPWLGVKYMAILLPLSVFFCYYLRNHRFDIIAFLTPIMLSGGLYGWFLYSNFGTFSPIANYIGTGEATIVPVFAITQFFSLTSYLSYFFGQRIGLFFYAPIFLLIIPGLYVLVKKFKSQKNYGFLWIMIFPALLYFLTYVYSGAVGGFSPPSRPLVAILPVFIVLMAYGIDFFIANNLKSSIVFLTLMSLQISTVLLQNPNWLFPSGNKSTMLIFIAKNNFVDFSNVFPTFPDGSGMDVTYLILWILLIGLMLCIDFLYRELKNAHKRLKEKLNETIMDH